MDIQTFTTELEKLTALPAEQVKRAYAIGIELSDENREGLLGSLTQLDRQLRELLAISMQSLEGFERTLHDAGVNMKRIERGVEEEEDHSGSLQNVERKLTDHS